MALVDSLLTAMVRADGDALVMHVGERPIVVSGARTVDLSSHGMNLGAMVGMLGQLLPGDALAALKEFGAVEHDLPARGDDRFSVVAARSGDDIWIEIRRRREMAAAPIPDLVPPPPAVEDEPVATTADAATAEVTHQEPEPGAIAVATEPTATSEPVEALAPAAAMVEAGESAAEPVELVVGDAVPVVEHVDVAAEPVEVVAEHQAVIEHAEAVAEPVDLVAEPVEPAAEPVDLVAEPVEPAAEPVDLVAEPVEPAVEPADAAADHVDAITEPVEPVVAPAEEVEEVVTMEPAAVHTDAPAVETPLHEEEPALEVLASASASAYPVSSVAPGVPMEPARHVGPSAGVSPSVPAAPPAVSSGGSTGGDATGSAGLPEAPVTRTVRIEVPARAASSRATGIDRLLRSADAVGASELFLVSHARPYVRVTGNVRALQDEAPLQPADIEALISDVTPEPWRDAVRRGDPAEWLIELADVGRVRCSTFRDHRGPGANFHFAFLRAATADELQLSPDTRLLATEPDGLVLVAGGPGNDRAAIVAAFLDILNHQRADYVITLEPQVRVQHVNREALISQREVGHEPSRVAAALRAALRETPDAVVIEGISTGEVAQLAIEAAADRLVIASIDAASTPAAVRRLLELVPIEQRQAARASLSRCFRGAVAQLMLRKSTGGRIAARELLTATRAVSRVVGEGDLSRLGEVFEGSATGMVPLADTIVEYVRAGLVDLREAVRKAPDAEVLVSRLGAAGVDLSALERWN